MTSGSAGTANGRRRRQPDARRQRQQVHQLGDRPEHGEHRGGRIGAAARRVDDQREVGADGLAGERFGRGLHLLDAAASESVLHVGGGSPGSASGGVGSTVSGGAGSGLDRRPRRSSAVPT